MKRAGVATLTLIVLLFGCSRSPEAKRDRYLQTGKEHFAKKDYNRALLAFRNAMTAMPKDSEPLYQLGVTAAAMGDALSAVEFLNRAVGLNPKHLDAQVKLADLYAHSRHEATVAEAANLANKVLSVSPDNAEAVNVLALTELRSGHVDDAKARLEEALQRFPANLQLSVNLARAHVSQQDTQSAEGVLRSAVDKEPKNAQALFALADFYRIIKKSEEAAECFARGLNLDPDYAPGLLSLGQIQAQRGKAAEADQTFSRLAANPDKRFRFVHALYLYESGKRDVAISELERMFKADGNDREARSYLSNAYLGTGRSAEVEKLWTEALAKNGRDSDALLHRARYHLSRHSLDLAERDLRVTLQYQPDSAEAHYLLSRVHRDRGQMGLQQEELGAALRLNPKSLPVRVELSQVLMGINEPKGALQVIDDAPQDQKKQLPVVLQRNWVLLALNRDAEVRTNVDGVLGKGNHPEAVLQDAVLRLRAKDFKGAQASAEKALGLNAEDVRALELIVRSTASQNRRDEGLDIVRRHAAKTTKAPAVQMFAGRLELAAGHREQARAAFRAAKAADPNATDADLILGEMDMSDGKLDEARQKLKPLLGGKRDSAVQALLGAVELQARNYEAACEHYRKALELNQRNVLVLNDLAYVLAEHIGKPMEALRYAQKAKELAPNNAAIDDTLGWTYYKSGMYAPAIRHLEAAVKEQPRALRLAHLALAYAKNGDPERGKRTLETALKMDPTLPEIDLARRAISEAKGLPR